MPVETKIDPRVVERVPGVVAGVIEEELLALGSHLDGLVKRSIRDKNAINTTALVGSYVADKPGEQPGVIAVRVGTPLEYGNYMEFGTEPHMPPLEPIKQWVENKLNVIAVGIKFKDGRAVPTGKGIRQFSRIRNRDKREAEILRVARAVQFAIAKRGLQPRHFVRESLEAMGLSYTLNADYVYEIDTIKSLASLGNEFWKKVAERLN